MSRRSPEFSPVLISEVGGIRYLHFGTEWIQGAMRIRDPLKIVLGYARQMLAWMLIKDEPAHIVQLGLGTGALTKFCHAYFADSRFTAVELNPEVISVCASMFYLPVESERLTVLQGDALDFVLDAGNHASADVIHVDLYDATDRGPVLDTPEFYSGCRRSLKADGVMTVNLFGRHSSYRKNLAAIQQAFPCVYTMPECSEGNRVVLAFTKTPALDFRQMIERARLIRQKTAVPALKWVKELKAAAR